MKRGIIYGLVCPMTDKIRYIGKTIQAPNKRLNSHISDLNVAIRDNKVSNHRLRWLRIVKNNGLIRHLKMIIVESCDKSELDNKEVFWIQELKRQGYRLTNRSGGGGFDYNYHTTKDHKKSISDGLKAYYAKYGKKKGINSPSSLPVSTVDINKGTITNYHSIRLCADALGVSDKLIPYLRDNKRSFNKLAIINTSSLNSFNNDGYTDYKAECENWVAIDLINVHYGVMEQFNNIAACARQFNIDKGTMFDYVKQKRIFGGCWIAVVSDDQCEMSEYSFIKSMPENTHKIKILDLHNNTEHIFKSQVECASFLGVCKAAACCGIKRSTNSGIPYKNRYTFEIEQSILSEGKNKNIHILAKCDDDVKQFKSLREAANTFNISRTALMASIRSGIPRNGWLFSRGFLVP